MERVFRESGVRPADIPLGLVVFNGLLWVEWLSVFAVAVRRRPLRYLKVHSPRFQALHARLRGWRIYAGLERYTMMSAHKVSSYRWCQRLGQRLGVAPSDLSFGTIETIIIYNTLLPVLWTPVNLASAVAAIRYYRHRQASGGDDDGSGGEDSGEGGAERDHRSAEKVKDDRGSTRKMSATQTLFSLRKRVGLQPATTCLNLGMGGEMERRRIVDVFVCAL